MNDNNNEIINNNTVFSSFLKCMYSDYDDCYTDYISFIFHYNKILIGYLEQKLIPDFDRYYEIYSKKLHNIIQLLNYNYPINSWDAILDRYNQIYNNSNNIISIDVDQFIVVLIFDQIEYLEDVQNYYKGIYIYILFICYLFII